MSELVLKNFSNNVAILQLENLNSVNRLKTYAKSLPNGSIIVLGEYVIDPFFSQNWEKKPDNKLKDKHKLDLLLSFCADFNHIIIAPCINYKNKAYYKNILILTKNKTYTYAQQRLIGYEHWDEVNFFSNDYSRLIKPPFTFNANGVKFGVLFGFETHFDEFWMEFKKADVDCVLVPTASTFNSQERWAHLLTTHSFTNSCYVFRANRIGKVIANDGYEWNFYGHSFVSLGSEILDSLDDNEGMLSVEIDLETLEKIKKEWNFR